jgi:hypothetical protein
MLEVFTVLPPYHEHLQHIKSLLQFIVHNSVHYIFYIKEFTAVFLHAKVQYIWQSFYTVYYAAS